MNLSPINNNSAHNRIQDINNQSDEFDEASDTLNGVNDNAAHNSTSVHIVELSSVVE